MNISHLIANYGDAIGGVLLALIGIIAGSTLAQKWGRANGRKLGKQVARVIPGNQVEDWLAEFLDGFKEGLAGNPEPVEVREVKKEKKGNGDVAFKIEMGPYRF